jgi:GH15 family glucan-1,4-alpha-glucosidase
MVPPWGALAGIRPLSVVDASLLGVSTPYRLLSPDEPLMRATMARVESDLHRPGGGVYRYRDDTYYGGGEWLLLAAWLGWSYTEVGERGRARALLHWIEAQASLTGDLPEQVSTHLLAPAYYSEWEARWGTVASPLLWSHAMYVVLCRALA